MSLDGPWDFRLERTMDNRWGDFRYPPSAEWIGAEARRFRYMEEEEQAGIELGWHEAEFDDSRWEQVTFSYGPYWWTIGPFEGSEPPGILDGARSGRIAMDEPCEVEGRSFRWRKCSFSQQFGHEGKEAHNRVGGGLRGVSEDFLLFDTASEERDAARYLFTSVHSPREQEYVLNFGGTAEFAREAWVNGKPAVSVSSRKAEAQAAVRLKEGWNSVLLRLVQPRGERLATFAVLHRPGEEPPCDPCVPLLRWFAKPQELLFDITPGKERRVGWYRFTAPPGLESDDPEPEGRSGLCVDRWTARRRGAGPDLPRNPEERNLPDRPEGGAGAGALRRGRLRVARGLRVRAGKDPPSETGAGTGWRPTRVGRCTAGG